MKIAVVGAGFTPTEADNLRRAMATFRKTGKIYGFRDKFIDGMTARGYAEDFATRCFKQIEGFGDYGFPESHAASFALLVYVSAWLKCHYPTAFAAAILNSQPMGFYAPAQLVRDARDHGAIIGPVDVNHSDWDCTLESRSQGRVALRLGLRQIKGLREADAERLIAARGRGYGDIRELWRRSGLSPKVLERLAKADAFASLGLNRRAALWAVRGLSDTVLPLFAAAEERDALLTLQNEPEAVLPRAGIGEQVIDDYTSLRLSLKAHPMKLLRPRFRAERVITAQTLGTVETDTLVRVAGLVLCRQRPGTASGVIFATLEDETGVVNVIVWPKVFERFRKTVLRSRLLGITGIVQREGRVIHVIARRLEDLSDRLGDLARDDPPASDKLPLVVSPAAPVASPANFPSRDFH